MASLEIIYQDKRILVALKPSGVLSTDEPGGMPELLRKELGDDKACVRTVHRLDQTVSGLMVFARSREASRILSRQIMEHQFRKEYLAVVHGVPPEKTGRFCDLLLRRKEERKTYVVSAPEKGAQDAILDYDVLATTAGLSLVKIRLHTGRTHQIRVQFASRGLPLVGDKKYGLLEDTVPIALFSCELGFSHPETRENMHFRHDPPQIEPWTGFSFG